jgi:hypothetical protein
MKMVGQPDRVVVYTTGPWNPTCLPPGTYELSRMGAYGEYEGRHHIPEDHRGTLPLTREQFQELIVWLESIGTKVVLK